LLAYGNNEGSLYLYDIRNMYFDKHLKPNHFFAMHHGKEGNSVIDIVLDETKLIYVYQNIHAMHMKDIFNSEKKDCLNEQISDLELRTFDIQARKIETIDQYLIVGDFSGNIDSYNFYNDDDYNQNNEEDDDNNLICTVM